MGGRSLVAWFRVVGLVLVLEFVAVAASEVVSAQSLPDVISEVIVEGNQRIEAETVRSYLLVAPGSRFDRVRIDRSLKALFATGLFADVTIRRQGTALVVRVVENPIINRLAFEGNRRIDDETLQAEVQLRPRVVYTRTRVQNDVQRIIQLYRRSGRFAATVEPKVVQLAQNRVDLVFEIREGPLTRIRKISFVGNRRFSDRKLRAAIATSESRWYRFLTTTDTYDPDRLTLDRELLRKYYLERGYADMRVISAVAELTPDRKDFFVTFTIEEGEPYVFGAIDIATTLKDLEPKSLLNLVTTVEGETYNAEKVEESIEALTFEVGRLGYAFVEIRPRINRNREARTIDITYEVEQGPRVYVERINISGNVRTLDKVIRREFRLAEGDAFNTAKLRRSRQRIRALGFFDTVEVKREKGSAPDRTVINVNVQERSTGELSIGAGFSTAENLVGDVSIRERNLLGKGQDLRANIGLSSRRQEIDLSFTEPYFLERNISAGFDLFRRRTEFQDESAFDERETGLTLRSGFPITERLRQSVSYTIRRDIIEDVPDDASAFIKKEEGGRTTSAIGYGLTYDLRDDKFEPTRGYMVRFNQELAGLGGTVRFLRTRLQYAHYFPLARDVVLNLSFREGYITGIGQDVRLGDRFFLGGGTFRGFATGGVGPRDKSTRDALGGKIFYVGGAEVSFPIGLPNEYGVLGRMFAEAGSLADSGLSGSDLFDVGSVRVSVGVGTSWRSPFGPIRVDLATPLRREDLDEIEAFRFSFGTRF